MSANTTRWAGVDGILSAMTEYENRTRYAVNQVAVYFSGVLEAYAKENASWEDQTGNARQTLTSYVADLSQNTVVLYLSHGVEYGIYLEVCHGGAYQILWPSIESHLPAIKQMLDGIFR